MKIFVLGCALLALASCKRDKPEIDGLGPYRVGVMKMKDYHGAACRDLDDGTAYCSTLETLDLGDQKAAVDLYFESKDLEAPLVEILLAVRRCREKALEKMLLDKLGAPGSRSRGVLIWEQKKAVIIATLSADEGVCELSFLEPGQKKRIEKLKARASR